MSIFSRKQKQSLKPTSGKFIAWLNEVGQIQVTDGLKLVLLGDSFDFNRWIRNNAVAEIDVQWGDPSRDSELAKNPTYGFQQ